MKILTGNDLKTGAVTWWDGENWSPHVDDAVDVGEHGEEVGEEVLKMCRPDAQGERAVR